MSRIPPPAHPVEKVARADPPSPTTTLPITDGLVLHLDAFDPLKNGGTALPTGGSTPAKWRDMSSAGHDATGLVGAPVWIADGGASWNNQPVFRFDGDDAYRIGDDANTDQLGLHGVATEVTIITVINPQGNTIDGNTCWFGHTDTVALSTANLTWERNRRIFFPTGNEGHPDVAA